MKTVKALKAFEVISEPGDGTRYHYLMIVTDEGYRFKGLNSIHYMELIGYPLVAKAKDYNLSVPHLYKTIDSATSWGFLNNMTDYNCWTLAEQLRTIIEYEEKSK